MTLSEEQPKQEEQLCIVVHGSHEVASLAGDLNVRLRECELAAKQDIPGPDLLLTLGTSTPEPDELSRAWQEEFSARTPADLPTQEQILRHRGGCTRITLLITAPLLYDKGCWYASGVCTGDRPVATSYFPLVELASQLAPPIFTSAKLLFHPARCELGSGHTPVDSPDDVALEELERELNQVFARPAGSNGRNTPVPMLKSSGRWVCRVTVPVQALKDGLHERVYLDEVPLFWLASSLEGCEPLGPGSLEASQRVGIVTLDVQSPWCLRLATCLREFGCESVAGPLEDVARGEPHAVVILEDLALWPRSEVRDALEVLRRRRVPLLLLALEPPPAEPAAVRWRMPKATHRGATGSVQQALWLAGQSRDRAEMGFAEHHELLDAMNAAVEKLASEHTDLWTAFLNIHHARTSGFPARPYFGLEHSVTDLWERAVDLLSFLDGKDCFYAPNDVEIATPLKNLLRMLAKLRRTSGFEAAPRLHPRIGVLVDAADAGDETFMNEAQNLYGQLVERADCNRDLPTIDALEQANPERGLPKGKLLVYLTRGRGAPPANIVQERGAGRAFVVVLGAEHAADGAWKALASKADHADDVERLWQEVNEHLNKNRVFVVHAGADLTKAQRLVADLEKKGYLCWLAPREGVADRIESLLRRQLERCACAVVLMSERASQSKWVREELSHLKKLESERSRGPNESALYVGVELPCAHSPALDEWKAEFFHGQALAPWSESNEHVNSIARWLQERKVRTVPGECR